MNDGFKSVSLETLAPELRAGPPTPPTQSTDVYALGRLAYFILTGGDRPVDRATLTQVTRGNLSKMVPLLNDLEVEMPGAADLLVAWLVDRQPVAESLQQQYLLLAAKQKAVSNDDIALLLTGWSCETQNKQKKGGEGAFLFFDLLLSFCPFFLRSPRWRTGQCDSGAGVEPQRPAGWQHPKRCSCARWLCGSSASLPRPLGRHQRAATKRCWPVVACRGCRASRSRT